MNFLKRNDAAPGNSDALSSRSDDRRDYLVKLMAMMAKKSESTTVHTQVAEEKTTDRDQEGWFSEFALRKEFGDAKAQLWLDSGKLKKRPDKLTGPEKPEHVEYRVTQDVKITDSSHAQGSTVRAQHASLEADAANVDSLAIQAAGSSGQAGETNIKSEPTSDDKADTEEKKKEKYDSCALVRPQLVELQSLTV